MEKLVLSNGAEYLLCTDGVNQYNGVATFKVRPMEKGDLTPKLTSYSNADLS